MYQVDDEPPTSEPLETIHLYVVREGSQTPSPTSAIFFALVFLFTLSLLIAIGVTVPYQQPEQRASLRVPAVLLPLRTFTTSIAVMPTGIRTYPATIAQGTLTITNGSILSEELPQGMILTGKDGVEVITDAAVFIPAGSAAGYGIASVSAYAAKSGTSGNIPTLDIDSVEGTALYIRNLHPFSGGAGSYSVNFITSQDRLNALSEARVTLFRQTLSGLLSRPCLEHITGTTSLHVAWTCQFVTYRLPSLPHVRVLQVQVIGRIMFLTITYEPRPQHLETK